MSIACQTVLTEDGRLLKCSDKCLACNVAGYEAASIDFLRQFVKDSTLFIDIGAHVGLYCLAFRKWAGKMFAIEPHPAHFKTLTENVKDMRNIATFHGAVWSTNYGTHFVEKAPGQHYCTLGENNCKSITLDSIVNMEFLQRVVVKIDAEGAELEILKGGKQALRDKIVAIVIEIDRNHLSRNNHTPTEVHNLLEEYGFEMVNFSEKDKAKRKLKAHFKKRGE